MVCAKRLGYDSGSHKKALTQKAIIEVIGNHKGFSLAAKKRFAKNVISGLESILLSGQTPYPDSILLKDLESSLKQLEKSANRLLKLAKEHPFCDAIIGVTARNLTGHKRANGENSNYRLVELDGVSTFAEHALEHMEHEMFHNPQKGKDIRYASRIAMLVARSYEQQFNAKPAITRAREDTTDTLKKTPYQRVCELVAHHTGCEIGWRVQQKAIGSMNQDDGSKTFFMPKNPLLPKKS